MALPNYTSQSITSGDINFSGGLNSTAGPLKLKDNESPDCQNVDFSKFGSIVPRNGFTALNTSAITNTPNSDGLYWFEFDVSGTLTRKLVNIADGKLFKMDDLDGTWDDATNSITITADKNCTFATFLKKMYVANGTEAFEWDGAGTSSAAASTLPANVTKPKYVVEFNNYLFYGHIVLSGTTNNSRIYWSGLKNTSTYSVTDFIDIGKDDGQEITGLVVLQDRLIIYKTRSIYTLFFTGNADIPFILPGGGKTNSTVGCVAPRTIQQVENGHVFLSSDGFYFFDGNNSFKISEKVSDTILGTVQSRFDSAVAINQRDKNRYWCALTADGGSTNDRVLAWDYFNNAWTLYVGINASAMALVYVTGTEERPYFADYGGFVYRGDTGTNDFPSNVSTKVTAYYLTNWRPYQDLVHQKGIPQALIYYQTSDSTLTFGVSYDFSESGAPNTGSLPGTDFKYTFSTTAGTSKYGTAVYGTGTYAGVGGAIERRDLVGRGRVIQFLFGNATIGETFQIDGIGTLAYLETNA